jgi:hypothetical protein
LADARPLAFRPPDALLPSLRCHAGVFAMRHPLKMLAATLVNWTDSRKTPAT